VFSYPYEYETGEYSVEVLSSQQIGFQLGFFKTQQSLIVSASSAAANAEKKKETHRDSTFWFRILTRSHLSPL
jgi:hypothetical protein